jgi:hypothetical protein
MKGSEEGGAVFDEEHGAIVFIEFGTVASIHHKGHRRSPTFGSSEPSPRRFFFFFCSIREDVFASLFRVFRLATVKLPKSWYIMMTRKCALIRSRRVIRRL